MALPKVNVLPGIVRKWLEQLGLLPETFLSVLNDYATRFDVPAEYGAAVREWIENAVDVGENAVVATLLASWAEWNSGNPGYDSESGSSA